MKTMAFGRVGDCIVVALGARRPADRDWDMYLHFLSLLPRGTRYRVLLWTRGGAPDGRQRRALDQAVSDLLANARIALVSESSIVRGFVAAMSVLLPAYRPFAPADLEEAFLYLGLGGTARADVARAMDQIREQISIPAPVAQV